MYVVAIVQLAATVDAEAAALAVDLGATVYECRLSLAAGTPAVVLTTTDQEQAFDLVARLRARGHGAIAVESAAVVSSSAMVSMRRFRLGVSTITLEDRPDELPYADIGAFIAAVHRRHTANDGETRDRQLSIGRAVVTGGLVMTKTVKHETHSEATEREPVLYVFRRSDAAPWILRERGTMWAGHGGPVSPLASANFKTTVERLRERSPGAAYDDRLVARRSVPERLTVTSGTAGTTKISSSAAGVDLFAHLLARWALRG